MRSHPRDCLKKPEQAEVVGVVRGPEARAMLLPVSQALAKRSAETGLAACGLADFEASAALLPLPVA